MKKIFILLCFILFTASCGLSQNITPSETINQSGDKTAVSGDVSTADTDTGISEENIEPTPEEPTAVPADQDDATTALIDVTSWGQITKKLKTTYTENPQFLACMEDTVDSCITEASYALDEFNCDDYILEYNKVECKESKIMEQARTEQKIELCNELTQNKEYCKLEVAMSIGMPNGDISVCEEVSDENKIQCNNDILMEKARSTQDASVCDGMLTYSEGTEENYEKNFCIEEVSFLQNDPSVINDASDDVLPEIPDASDDVLPEA